MASSKRRGFTSRMYNSNRSCYFKEKYASLVNFTVDKNLISTKISKNRDIDDLKEWINKETPISIEESTHYKLLKRHITFSDKNSVYKIARDLSKISGSLITPSHIFEYKLRPKRLLKNFLNKVWNKMYKKKDYVPKLPKSNKMQNGIKLSECKYFLSLMYPDLKYDLEEPYVDLVKIERG